MRAWTTVGILAVLLTVLCVNLCCEMASFDCSKSGVSVIPEEDLRYSEDETVIE